LSKILPEAMIAFLENHPPEKFAEIFLGNFDTPEAIWNQEMRRFMISRLAAHLADFTPRLKSNVRSIYHHIGIPRIVYEQLEGELFCNRYYLRHFCDTARFPDWPVKDPIALLRDILAFWRVETEKKPSRITYEDSLRELGLEASQLNE
uniref:Radical SAM protein n=1 Tax=Hydatigena taeniaeformis TaxID=6205 RepID=A0A0R3WYX5_HYDTA